MRSYAQSCVDWVVNHENFIAQLTVTEGWMTKTTFGGKVTKHIHMNSVLSGIFYLQDNPNGTKFETESRLYNDWPMMFKFNESKIKYLSPSKQGQLILFPSILKHSVDPLRSMSIRHTWAFNTFYKGQISDHDTMQLHLTAFDLEKPIN